MAESVLARKLRLKAGRQAVVINTPPGYASGLGVEVSTELAGIPDASVGFIQMFVKTSHEVEDLIPAVLRVLRHDGLLWISYPKGTSKVKTDLNRRKNDFRDAEMAAELLRTGEFTETRLPRGVYAELRAAYNAYRRLVKERTRITNLLKGLLDGRFCSP